MCQTHANEVMVNAIQSLADMAAHVDEKELRSQLVEEAVALARAIRGAAVLAAPSACAPIAADAGKPEPAAAATSALAQSNGSGGTTPPQSSPAEKPAESYSASACGHVAPDGRACVKPAGHEGKHWFGGKSAEPSAPAAPPAPAAQPAPAPAAPAAPAAVTVETLRRDLTYIQTVLWKDKPSEKAVEDLRAIMEKATGSAQLSRVDAAKYPALQAEIDKLLGR